jgi:hypothetical protein
MDSKITIKYIVFAKEMIKFMEFQKFIDIHHNFNKKSILIDYFEELYNYISNFDLNFNNKKYNIINMIKTLITQKIIINTDFLENDETFDEDYIIVIELLRLILEYNNIEENFEEIDEKKEKVEKNFKIQID